MLARSQIFPTTEQNSAAWSARCADQQTAMDSVSIPVLAWTSAIASIILISAVETIVVAREFVRCAEKTFGSSIRSCCSGGHRMLGELPCPACSDVYIGGVVTYMRHMTERTHHEHGSGACGSDIGSHVETCDSTMGSCTEDSCSEASLSTGSRIEDFDDVALAVTTLSSSEVDDGRIMLLAADEDDDQSARIMMMTAKDYGKPSLFDGSEELWAEWSFAARAYLVVAGVSEARPTRQDREDGARDNIGDDRAGIGDEEPDNVLRAGDVVSRKGQHDLENSASWHGL